MNGHINQTLDGQPPPTTIDIPGIGAITMALHAHGDRWISDVIRRGEIFDPQILNVLRELVVPGTTLIDVGANIGWFTVIGSRLVGPGGHVLAVEPDPTNLRLLRHSVASNFCENVTVLPFAAGDAARDALLFRSDDNQGDHRLEIASDRTDSVLVPVQTLDTLVGHATGTVSAMKIDTQGSESAVLRGMPALLAAHPRIRVLLEYWPYGLLQCGSSAEELADLLGRRHGSIWVLSADGMTQETSPQGLRDLAAARLAPQTQGAVDLVWLDRDDAPAVAAMQRRRKWRGANALRNMWRQGRRIGGRPLSSLARTLKAPVQ